mmetsp:Transcript_48869/g.59113  ORF Transcript_48869/g.59113 Transcript_48869/m.59113 type:complete len:401 (+) Transcript_48869:82-1284(+)
MALKEVSNILNNKPVTGSKGKAKGKGKSKSRTKKSTASPENDPAVPTRTDETPLITVGIHNNNASSTTKETETTNAVVAPDTSDDTKATKDNEDAHNPDTLAVPAKDNIDGLTNVFGKISLVQVPSNVRKVYKIIRNCTGSIGGNGAGGAIYGELTVGSMQKVIDIMKDKLEFTAGSRFIDVGCGLAKPNMHVVQDPGVEFSYGIELNKERWFLGLHNLNNVLKAARDEKEGGDGETIGYRCMLAHGDIVEAKSFDPFTHVYMFDIGFPPHLFDTLAKMFKRSKSKYLICYHSPRIMIDRYGFEIELICKEATSMHGSSEGHTCYFYKRIGCEYDANPSIDKTRCDPLFSGALKLVQSGLDELADSVEEQFVEEMGAGRPRRSRRAPKQFLPGEDNSMKK